MEIALGVGKKNPGKPVKALTTFLSEYDIRNWFGVMLTWSKIWKFIHDKQELYVIRGT